MSSKLIYPSCYSAIAAPHYQVSYNCRHDWSCVHCDLLCTYFTLRRWRNSWCSWYSQVRWGIWREWMHMAQSNLQMSLSLLGKGAQLGDRRFMRSWLEDLSWPSNIGMSLWRGLPVWALWCFLDFCHPWSLLVWQTLRRFAFHVPISTLSNLWSILLVSPCLESPSHSTGCSWFCMSRSLTFGNIFKTCRQPNEDPMFSTEPKSEVALQHAIRSCKQSPWLCVLGS